MNYVTGQFRIRPWETNSPRHLVESAAVTVYAHPVQFSGSLEACQAYVAAPKAARQLLAAACSVAGWSHGVFLGVL